MIIDPMATNPAFAEGRMPVEDINELMDWARSRLGLNGMRPWKLISARRKLSKVLFEIEEQRAHGPVRLIGKISTDERTRIGFDALHALWYAGFCPPSRYTVVEPLALFEERNLMILERAPGVELICKVEAKDESVPDLIQQTARWLVRLHAAPVPVEPWQDEPGRLERWAEDLTGISPAHASRILDLTSAVSHTVGAPTGDLVPCHGDFHMLNMFVADGGRMVGIDMDKFGGREVAEEVGYFLAQTASICFHRLGSFAESACMRELFLRTYEQEAGVSLSRAKLGAYMAGTLVKNLHFDLFTYRSGRIHILDSWLDAAASCVNGDIGIT